MAPLRTVSGFVMKRRVASAMHVFLRCTLEHISAALLAPC